MSSTFPDEATEPIVISIKFETKAPAASMSIALPASRFVPRSISIACALDELAGLRPIEITLPEVFTASISMEAALVRLVPVISSASILLPGVISIEPGVRAPVTTKAPETVSPVFNI